MYFAGDMEREVALARLDEMLTSAWFNTSQAQPMVSTDFKIAFYNQNDETGMILKYQF